MSAAPATAVPRPGLGLQLGYGLGSAAFGVGGAALSQGLLQLYFNQVIGLPAIWVGAALMATIAVDAVVDPLIGTYSDRLRSPLGRRHTLMYLAAIPAALGFCLMWQAPEGLPPLGLLAFMIGMLVFVNVSYSFYEIPSLALAPELAPDYDDRTRLLGMRWVFLIVGGAAMNLMLYQVFLRQDESNPLGILNKERYADFGAVAAIAILATILISTAATQRRVKLLHVPPPERTSLKAGLAQARASLNHGPLVTMMFVGLFMGFGAGATAGQAAYFNLHFWGVMPQDLGWLVLAGLVASFLAVWAAPAVGARLGKKRAMVCLYLGWLAAAIGPICLRLVGLMPPNGTAALLAILIVVGLAGGMMAICCHVLLSSTIADTIDDIAVRTGARSEGMLFAAFGVLSKFAAGGGAFVGGAILTAVAFPPHARPGTVDPEILRNMALVNVPIIAFFNLASIWFLSRYSLTREDQERNAAILAARRAAERPAPLGPVGLAGGAAAESRP